jgi:hypothetical protein
MTIVPIFATNRNRVVGYMISEHLSADDIIDIINSEFSGYFPDLTTEEFNETFPGCKWQSKTTVDNNTIECQF